MLRRGGGIAEISSTSMSASQLSLKNEIDCGRTVVMLPFATASQTRARSTAAPDPPPLAGPSLHGMGVSFATCFTVPLQAHLMPGRWPAPTTATTRDALHMQEKVSRSACPWYIHQDQRHHSSGMHVHTGRKHAAVAHVLPSTQARVAHLPASRRMTATMYWSRSYISGAMIAGNSRPSSLNACNSKGWGGGVYQA
jgi:hypothetical protein